jgi:hypothetical protein
MSERKAFLVEPFAGTVEGEAIGTFADRALGPSA